MKPFELTYLCLEPFLLPLHKKVRRRLRQFAGTRPHRPSILDVGGRKSHYTIGVPADITITDLPRETEVQKKLNLGITEAIVAQNRSRRSNVRGVLYDDMTRSTLPENSFDCVVAVEVLEHVEEDALFVKEVHRVLRPGGLFFMTTPNGDFVKNTNPDHKRHYRREELRAKLASCFGQVEVQYAIRGGRCRRWGLKAWSVRHPLRTAASMVGNWINSIQSARADLNEQPVGTHHLIALAQKTV